MDELKISGFFDRVRDAICDGNMSEARNYCVCIIEKDPHKKSAITLKRFIEQRLKQENGRYVKNISAYQFGALLTDVLIDKTLVCDNEILKTCCSIIETMSSITLEFFLEMIEFAINEECDKNSPKVFLIFHNLLWNVKDVPNDESVKKILKIIEILGANKDDCVINFVKDLKRFYLGLKDIQKNMVSDYQNLERDFEELYKKRDFLKSKNKFWGILSTILICVAIIVWLIIIFYGGRL